MERLIRALLPAEDADEALRGFYTDALHAKLVKRLANPRGDSAAGFGERRLRGWWALARPEPTQRIAAE